MTSPGTEKSFPASPRRWRQRAAWSAVAALILGATGWGLWKQQPVESTPADPAPPAGLPLFLDVTAASGVAFTYRNGEEANLYTILESLGGGVALLDFDGDGLLDLFVTGGGEFTASTPRQIKGKAGRLYRNLGNWKFTDVTAQAGLGDASRYTHACVVGDIDNDGWPDLLITGFGGMALYHNVGDGKGGRRFVDVTRQWGLVDPRWCTGAAWGDLTGKGWADLYVCRYVEWDFGTSLLCPSKAEGQERDVCPPQMFKAMPSSLYRRGPDGVFEDVSAAAGLRTDGKGLGVVVADLNGDGRPDLYVANDASDNFLYLNRGGGRLEEKGVPAGVAVDDNGRYNGSMGVDVGDYDGSGRASLWVTNFQGESHALYRNTGKECFSYQSQAAGIGALGQQFVGFGTGFVDVDNDGWLDLFIANGHVLRHPVGAPARQLPVLLRNVENQGRRFFREISGRQGPFFATPALGRGVAVGDLDNDGWPDLVVSHTNGPVTILRNQGRRNGQPAHWLGVQLVGRGNRPVAGATLTLEVEGRKLTRFLKGGGSYLSSGDPRVLFGLGPATRVGRLTVRWPWGEVQHHDSLPIDRYWELGEGDPAPRPPRAIRP